MITAHSLLFDLDMEVPRVTFKDSLADLKSLRRSKSAFQIFNLRLKNHVQRLSCRKRPRATPLTLFTKITTVTDMETLFRFKKLSVTDTPPPRFTGGGMQERERV